jgi:GGDEF domain-containing protein
VRDEANGPSAERSPVEQLAHAAHAARQLCDVLWESLHRELRENPSEERVRELSERLATVSSTVAMLAGAARQAPVTERRTAPEPVAPEPPRSDPRSAPDLRLASNPQVTSTPPRSAERRSPSEPSKRRSVSETPVPLEPRSASEVPASFERRATTETPVSPPSRLSSESSSAPVLPGEPESPGALQSIPTRAGHYTFTRLVDEHESASQREPSASGKPSASGELSASGEPSEPRIEIRDVRREEGPSAWVTSVGRLLTRHSQDGLPFAVLLVEIVDVARLERSETPHDMHGLVAQVESALGRGMRSSDELSRETLGRYWLVAPETNGTGARMLAERLARLVRTSASHRGVPLEVAIGIAVCPEDGVEAPALAARADLGVYAARATGRSIAHSDPPA